MYLANIVWLLWLDWGCNNKKCNSTKNHCIRSQRRSLKKQHITNITNVIVYTQFSRKLQTQTNKHTNFSK